MLNTVPVNLSDSQKFLPGTLKWSYGPETEFFPHLVMWRPLPLSLDLNFSEMLNTASVSFFHGQNLLPGKLE